MPFAEHAMIQSAFVVPATLPASLNFNCGFLPTKIELVNMTAHGAANFNILNANWNSIIPGPTTVQYSNVAGTAVAYGQLLTNAISLYDGTQSVKLGAAIAGTAIDKTTSIVTAAAHGLQTGDIVIMTGLDVMKQIGGLKFSVTVLTANTFSIPIDLTSASFTNQANAFTIRKVVVGPLYFPEDMPISTMNQSPTITVSTTFVHNLQIGQQVRLRVSAANGMVQANNLQGKIISVPTTTSMVLNIDSSAFAAFVWPVGGAAFAPFTPAQVVPIGSAPSAVAIPPYWFEDKLVDTVSNVRFQGFTLGAGILNTAAPTVIGFAPGDIVAWTAWRADL